MSVSERRKFSRAFRARVHEIAFAQGETMRHRRNFFAYANGIPAAGVLALSAALAGCAMGPSVSGGFDRTLTVSGPLRLELANASGDVTITGSADNKVHIHADVHSSGIGLDSPQKRLDDIVSNPPIEQVPGTIRVGKDISRVHNVSIAYTIEVPRGTEVSTSVASGTQTVRNVHGPVKANAASGSINVDHVDKSAQLATLSGSVSASNIGEDLRASSASGSINVSNVKGDVRVNSLSGSARVSNAGGRVEIESVSGSVEVQGVAGDVKANAASGSVSVQGNPGPSSYWDLHTASGSVEISVPSNANFQLAADATSGQIKTEIPIVIEEQGKHSLRAHAGTGGGRIEIHTMSGEIRLR